RGSDRRAAGRHRRRRSGRHHHRGRAMTAFARAAKFLAFRRRAAAGKDNSIVLDSARKASGGRTRTRVLMTMAVFMAIYSTITGRLIWLGFQEPALSGPPPSRVTASRPDILDRNGIMLATDIKTASLYAEPRHIVDVD